MVSLSEADRAELVRLYEETNLSLKDIGAKFGLTATEVMQVYVPLPKEWLKSNFKTNPSARWTDEQAKEIRERARNGETIRSLSADLGGCREAIASLVYGRSYNYIDETCPPVEVPKRLGGCVKLKISDEEVVNIRERFKAGGITRTELAEEYGVAIHTMRLILTGRMRSDLPGPLTTDHNKANHFGKLTEEQVIDIRKRASRGERKAQIARSIGMSSDAIQNICCGKTYKDVGGPITVGTVPNMSPSQHLELIRLRSEGMSYRELRKHFHTSEHIVREWLGKVPEGLDTDANR